MMPLMTRMRRFTWLCDVVVEAGLAEELVERPAEHQREVLQLGERLPRQIGVVRGRVLVHPMSSRRDRAHAGAGGSR